MARMSPESRSAAAYLAGGSPPRPPAHLSRRAAALWRDIVRSRPVDFFKPGSVQLLANFCSLAAVQEVYLRDLSADPRNYELQRTVCRIAGSMNSAATKLKLTPSAIHDRKAGILTEKGEPERDGSDVLYGGSNVIKF